MMVSINSLNPRYTKVEDVDRVENFMIDIIMIRETIKIDIDQIVETEGFNLLLEYNMDRIMEVDQGMNNNYGNDYRRGNFRGNVRVYQNQNFRGRNNRNGYRGNYRNENYKIGRSRFRERSFSESNNRRDNRSTSNSRSRSGSRASTNRDRIRCYKCWEYDHLAKDCRPTKEKRGTEQIQQLFNLDKEQTSLKTLATDTYDSLSKINSLEDIAMVQEHLNL